MNEIFLNQLDKSKMEDHKRRCGLNLCEAVTRFSDSFPIDVSVSPDGKKALATYEIDITEEHTLVQELFDICDCELKSIAVNDDPEPSNFSVVSQGLASPDFERFSLVRTTDVESENPAFIVNVYDQNFQTLNQLVYSPASLGTDLYLPGYTVVGGSWSTDGKYIEVSYATTPGPDQKGRILILDSETLDVVASKRYKGAIINAGQFAEICDEQYLFVVRSKGAVDWNDLTGLCGIKAPHKLEVYHLACGKKNKKLKKVASVCLPQGSLGPTLFKEHGKLKVAIGTFLALNEGESSVYPLTCRNESALPNDSCEVRIYEVCVSKICYKLCDFKNHCDCKCRTVVEICIKFNLECANQIDSDVVGLLVAPSKDTIFVGRDLQNTGAFGPGVFEWGCRDKCIKSVNLAVPTGTWPSFSTDCKESVVLMGSANDEVNNLQLYRLHGCRCKIPSCKADCGCDHHKDCGCDHHKDCGCDHHKDCGCDHHKDCGCDHHKDCGCDHHKDCGCDHHKDCGCDHHKDCGCDHHKD